jgi:hypothetical protein
VIIICGMSTNDDLQKKGSHCGLLYDIIRLHGMNKTANNCANSRILIGDINVSYIFTAEVNSNKAAVHPILRFPCFSTVFPGKVINTSEQLPPHFHKFISYLQSTSYATEQNEQ